MKMLQYIARGCREKAEGCQKLIVYESLRRRKALKQPSHQQIQQFPQKPN